MYYKDKTSWVGTKNDKIPRKIKSNLSAHSKNDVTPLGFMSDYCNKVGSNHHRE